MPTMQDEMYKEAVKALNLIFEDKEADAEKRIETLTTLKEDIETLIEAIEAD